MYLRFSSEDLNFNPCPLTLQELILEKSVKNLTICKYKDQF